jgi:iron complex outermembrane receptor protein
MYFAYILQINFCFKYKALMKKLIFSLTFLFSSLFSQTLDSLLIQYEDTVDQSLKTVNEKLGHVVIYSQEELRLMQYNNLNDILKDFLL